MGNYRSRIIIVAYILTVGIFCIAGYCFADSRNGDIPTNNAIEDTEDTDNESSGGSKTTAKGCGDQKFETVTLEDGTKFVKTVGGTASLNCCRDDHINCVRWICGSSADFTAAWGNGHHGIGYSNETVKNCMNSNSQVCWAGRVVVKSDGIGFDVWNEQNITKKQNLGNTYNIGGGMGMSAETQSRMNAAANNLGSSLTGLAFWCDSLCDGDECYTPPPEDNGDCNSWSVGGDGVTDVLAAVKNESTGVGWIKQNSEMRIENVSGTQSFVWAKPGDSIHFRDCYYSGLQKYYNMNVTKGNSVPSNYGAPLLEGRTNNWLDYSSAKNSVVEANPLIPIQDDTSWATNGYSISGIVGGGGDKGKSTPPQMYQEDKYHTVDPIADLGYDSDGDFSERAQQIESLFKGGVRNFSSVELPKEWDCNPFYENVTKTREIADPGFEITGGLTPSTCLARNQGSIISYNPGGETVECQWWDNNRKKTESYIEKEKRTSTCSINQAKIVTYNFHNPTAVAATYFKVPYNYINYGEALFDDTIIYSGEKTPRIWGWAINAPRYNPRTGGTYATMAPNSEWGLVGYISDDPNGDSGKPGSLGTCDDMEYCKVYERGDGTLNPDGNLDGERRYIGGGVYNLWDVEAGKYFCSTVMVYSASSGNYENMDPIGDRTWYIAESNCRVISKKPTFQIRGSMYIESGSIIQGSVATKNNVKDNISFVYNRVGTDGTGKTRNFYSWVDQSLTIGRNVNTLTNFSSGAASQNKKEISAGGIYAINEKQFRTRSMQPLTLPTPQASAGESSLSGIGSVLNSSFKTTVVNSIVAKSGSSSTCDIKGYTAYSGERKVFYCDSDMTITGNILYQKDEKGTKFSSFEEIPIVIIYAKGNINIKPGVQTIDAWVITDKKLDTCVAKTDAEGCNVPLTINGTVLAHEIRLNRTYGAGAGNKSSYPAELFNLSPSAFMYSAAGAKEMDPNAIQSVYIRELAPRH